MVELTLLSSQDGLSWMRVRWGADGRWTTAAGPPAWLPRRDDVVLLMCIEHSPSRAQIESRSSRRRQNDIAQTVPLMKSALSAGRRLSELYDSSVAAGSELRACVCCFIARFCSANATATGDFNQRDQSLATGGIHDTCGPPTNVSGWKRRSTAVTRASSVISTTVKSNLFEDASPICNSEERHFGANCRANDT